uniref:Pentapeptide repeat protein-like protein n=1 Tax=Adineta vaga TaxID=104782 RepID=B3G4S4_ADIVA|nr:pentapeptide repeat protein-like protein [Adineta vaga]
MKHTESILVAYMRLFERHPILFQQKNFYQIYSRKTFNMPDKIISSSERSACFNWGRLLFSASFPLVLGIFSIIFTIQQNSISQANELRQQNIYDGYINDISKLLLSPTFNRSNPQQLNYIGFKTVDIIKHLSNAQKRNVIFFLYNHELIRRDKPISQRVNLTGAYLADAIFDGNNINQISFPHATLINSKFLGMKPFITNFTNADLLNSDLTNKDLSSMKHIIRNTRFPNGSFSVVDNSQLISDGGAEDACNRSLRKKDWMVFEKSVGLDFYNTNSTNLNMPSGVSGNCYFGKNTTGVLYQYVSKMSYSLLINHEIAYFNLSALMGCTIPNRNNDHALIDVRCFDEFHSGPVCGGISIKSITSFCLFLFYFERIYRNK